MDTLKFIKDLGEAVRRYNGPAYKFAEEARINQTFLRRLLNGERKLSLDKAVSLWPFVYGAEFPKLPPEKQDAQSV